ncbi:MAG: OB-fold nucleic acid binding domain-containing protein [Oscillospiraceae bacterium]|nr:OB-fold nucleic acid binding domain-containing protein [Oscillospiraceae bacterium]
MAFVTVEDLYGSREIIVFDSTYRRAANILAEDTIVLIEGRLSIREDDEAKIVANNITVLNTESGYNERENIPQNIEFSTPDEARYEENSSINNKPKTLSLNITNLPEETKARLRGMIKFFSGDRNNMLLQVVDSGNVKPCGAIYLTEEIKKQFEELLGQDKVELL